LDKATNLLAGSRRMQKTLAGLRALTAGASQVMHAAPAWLTQALPWVFALALLVRLTSLTYHSLWFDEIMSTFWAAKPAAVIWQVGLALKSDKHPPLYYLLLRGWTFRFGGGDFAVRSLGAIIGALAVLPTYGIGRHLGGRKAAALAALLMALNPFLVWYSQEARMFMPAVTFALIGLYGLLSLVEAPGMAGFGFTVLGFTAALYSYLYSAFLLPVAGIWLLTWWWLHRARQRAARGLWLGITALAIAGAAFSPIASAAWHVSGVEAVHGQAFQGMWPSLAALLRVYTLGWPSWQPQITWPLAAAAGALALLGCLARGGAREDLGDRWGGAFLGVWFGTIILVGGYLLSRDSRVFAETRYQIALVPALCLAWGRALAWLWLRRRSAGLIGMSLFVGVTLLALPFDWTPQNRKEDWRQAAAFLEANAGPNDAIVIQADYVHVAFERYFHGSAKLFYPFTDKLSDPARVDPPLAGLSGFDRVWVLQSHQQELDPQNLLLGWFAARFPMITEVFPTGIAIHGFDQHYRTTQLPDGTNPTPAQRALGPLRLLSCQYAPASLPARDTQLHPPSNWIHVTTLWNTDTPTSRQLGVRLRLVDGAGQVWGEDLARSSDTFHVWPTSRWVPGEVVRADHDINLNPLTPPGKYRVVAEIPDTAGQAACGDVSITR
jgi:4-amino-4-deoxy-L-arabinose transferase-like glycosyltransferase